MARYLDLDDLPLQARGEADQEWLAHARREAESGFAEFDRGDGIRATADEHMARIDPAVRARAASRTGNPRTIRGGQVPRVP